MSRVGVVIWFDGAQVRAHPLLDDDGGAIELAERLPAFCRLVLADPDLASCLAGLHQHRAGSCARR